MFLKWNPGNVLLIVFFDTMMAIGMVIVAIAWSFARAGTDGREGAGAAALVLVKAILTAAFLVPILAIPLGVPLIFMLAGTGFSLFQARYDPNLRSALELQAVITVCWGVTLLWQLRKQTPEQAGLKPIFALTFLRWFLLIFLTFTGVPSMFGSFGPYLLVVVYSATLLFSEINPRRFLQIMPSLGK